MDYENCCLIKKDGKFLEFICVDNCEKLRNLRFKSHSFMPKSIYHNKDYVKLNLKSSDKMFEWSYEKDGAKFYNIAIKSKIPNTNYYDLNSVYGFGGLVCNDGEFLKNALNEQKKQALKQNIIAEFVRFSPDFLWITQAIKLADFFKKTSENIVVACSPKRYEFYSSRLKSKIKKAQKEILSKQSTNMHSFISLYYETMRRNSASDFNFF